MSSTALISLPRRDSFDTVGGRSLGMTLNSDPEQSTSVGARTGLQEHLEDPQESSKNPSPGAEAAANNRKSSKVLAAPIILVRL